MSFSFISDRYFCAEMEENKNLQITIQTWQHYAMVLLSYKAVKIYAEIMVKVTR